MNKPNLDVDPFDKQLCYCTVCAKSAKLITLEENIISVQQLPLCLPLFFVFSSEVLNSGMKSCFDGDVFQDAVCEECFIYVFGVFTFSVFCYCFYEGFIRKIILVSWFLLFICISFLLKIFRFDTGIFRALTENFEWTATECSFLFLILFHTFVCNIFRFAHL